MAKEGTVSDFRKFAKDKTSMCMSVLDDKIKSAENFVMPYILEERKLNVTSMDVYSRLLMDRIIFLNGEVDDGSCSTMVAQLLYLSSIDERDVNIYINSPGGSVVDGLALIDTMNFVNCDISTTCIGMAASMGAVLLSCGTKGKRFVLPHSRVMIHQVSNYTGGTLKDMEIELEQTVRCKKDLYEILSKQTDRTFEEIERDCDRNFWLIGQEAVDYRIADRLILKQK